jgi:predicted PurR-regulated permease PerM
VSKSVKLHPVAVILAVAVGVELAGIVGALFAVPLMAVVRSVYLTVKDRRRADDTDDTDDTAEADTEAQPSGASGPG